MYVIVVYDIAEERVSRICQFLKRYLPRVQNSVFEGDLPESKLESMKAGLAKRMDLEVDSVLIWVLREVRWAGRQVIGKEKLPVSQFF
ncbi:MAG TPA: CRISPR-associated endonuclease Cas2 [Chthonomonadaceae bacterium]|nr:CRISPR-associated endonuclease Cas2 [Chthonomonadaceae bacterium]